MSESEHQEAALPLNKQRRAFGAVESHYPLRDLAGWFRTFLGAFAIKSTAGDPYRIRYGVNAVQSVSSAGFSLKRILYG